MIRTSSHLTRFANTGKKDLYQEFLEEGRFYLQWWVNYIWENFVEKDVPLPIMMATPDVQLPANDLYARVHKCLMNQALGIVKGVVAKNERRKFINKTQNKNINLKKTSKPIITKKIGLELNSICAKFEEVDTLEFDGFLVLHSLGKKYGKIIIPIKNHRHSNKLKDKSETKKPRNSFLCREDYIDFRWDIPQPQRKSCKENIVVGADQGMNKILVMSNGQVTPDDLNEEYKEVNFKLTRKKKGSKAYYKAKDHQKNVINQAINKLSMEGIYEIRLEKLKNMRNGKRTSRYLSHFNYTAIDAKIRQVASENGVRVTEIPNKFRSQRCNSCGFVHKKNRKLEAFECNSCGHTDDADLNAAKNLAELLADISKSVWEGKLNRTTGFYWLKNKVVPCSGFAVPNGKK